MMKQHRFLIRVLIVPLALLILTACAAATQTPSPTPQSSEVSGDLTVLDWSGFDITEMWVDFAATHPDVLVDFELGVSDEDIFEKTQSVSGADVVHIYTPFIKFYVDEGLIQEIDTSQISHWDEIPEEFQNVCTFEGKVYCVPWDWGLTSILYRTDKITEPIESWDALFDEQYAGHIGMWDSGFGAFEVGSYVRGYNQGNLTEAQLAEIQQLWMDQREISGMYWLAEADLVQAMTNGDIWLSYAWNAAYYTLLEEGVPVAFATPKEGRASYVGAYAITTESDNPGAAMAFLDLKNGEQSATNLLTMYAYGSVIPQYFASVTDPNLIEALSLDDPTILERTQYAKPFTFETFEKFASLWDEVKAAP
jgi:spermidine/putrescine transport system substrate-binding protein